MSFINIAQQKQIVSFKEAVLNPIGDNKGIYFPREIKKLDSNVFASKDFNHIAVETLYNLTCGEIPKVQLQHMVGRAFNFPLSVHSLNPQLHVLELFHGPTLAFKDFGARFLAECLASFNKKQATIITATSGDTGAAVAHAFHGKSDIDVVILYPKGKISKEQEQLFCTLGDNIHTVKVDGDFDACQNLVKQAFNDNDIKQAHNLNSANSINVARLVAQVCYYNALPALLDKPIDKLVVPSGNFGNLTAAMIAKAMGAPIDHLVAATNINDTVPRFFMDKTWRPKETQRTLSNAMDVSQPNNFSRILYCYQKNLETLFDDMSAMSITDEETQEIIKQQAQQGYQVDPHTAVGLKAIQDRQPTFGSNNNLVVSTAHPAKFADVLEDILQQPMELPSAITEALHKPNLSKPLSNDFDDFKDYLLAMS
ncbi:threonine synthase [Kangiella shandongensis]|uniref:threonine synthase n=1 Tax=Kangiella shandongensis TaxID=2763258 RepID=UPI001CBAA0DB|nr:threonine synthase [Kangiella shandongensis]